MKRALLCVLLAVLLLCGCTRAPASTVRAPDAGEPLTLCLGTEPATLDPARTENGVGATYVVNLFSGLTGYRAGGDGSRELTPELCAELPVPESLPDGRVQYVFTLRDGLTWSDGTPLTAADFVYAWNRACTLEDAAAPYLFACIDGYGTGRLNVTASPDGRTLTVVLAEAMPTFLQLCAQPAYAPVPSGAADTMRRTADGAGFAVSGPYTVAAWTDEGLTYVKNPAYWDADNVTAETVRFAFEPDPDAAGAAFLARDYALVWPVPDAALDDLRTNHAPELRTVSRLATYSLCFPMNDPALSAFTQSERAQIRTALALLIDRSDLCAQITPGAQQSANAPIPPGISDADGSDFAAHNGADGNGTGYYSADYAANCQQAVTLLRQAADTMEDFTPDPAEISKAVEEQLDTMSAQLAQKNLTLEDYCKFTNSTLDQMREDARPGAEQAVRIKALVRKVAQLEDLHAAEEDVAQALSEICRANHMTMEELQPYYDDAFAAAVEYSILLAKVTKLIRTNAVLED